MRSRSKLKLESYIEPVENGTLDTLALSDAFRRNAIFPLRLSFEISEEIVKSVREIGVLSTYYYAEDGDSEGNQRLIERIGRAIKDIHHRAHSLQAEKIILPFVEQGQGCIFSDALFAHLKSANLDSDFSLRAEEYKKDLSAFGQIDPTIPTILDEGVRGVCHIDSELKFAWRLG